MHSLHVQPAPVHCTPITPVFQHCFSAPHFPGFPTSPGFPLVWSLSLSLSHTLSQFQRVHLFQLPPLQPLPHYPTPFLFQLFHPKRPLRM